MEEPPPSLPSQLLTSTTHLLTTLLTTHIPQTNHFKPKWSLIRTKLTTLQTHLSHLSSSSSYSNHPLLSTLLSSLSATFSSAVSLAGNCSHHHPHKLRTQNDLDSLLTSLSNLIHDFHVLLSSDPTSFDSDIAQLIIKIQVGSSALRMTAVDSLLHLLNRDDKNVVVAVSRGVIPVLVSSLGRSCSHDMRERIVGVIARVSEVDGSRNGLIGEGLVLLNSLIRVIESGSVFGKEKACVVLQVLSLCRENARAIGCRGGISSLLEICHGGTPNSQAMAVGVLRNLAKFQEIQENFIEEDAVQVLIMLSASGTPLARENAIGCLSNLVENDSTLKVMVVREGGIESLRNYWDSTLVGKSLEPGIELLKNLGSYHPIGEALINAGFVVKLMPLLNSGVLGLRILAAEAVYELGFCSKAGKEMGELGCVTSLVRMLDGKAIEEREVGAKALSRMLECSCNRKLFKKEERGIVGTVQLLDPLTKNMDKKWPISVLTLLAQSKKCRKQMVGAGACVYLQKLVELDVEGAKKLLESLGRGKLWGVFARP